MFHNYKLVLLSIVNDLLIDLIIKIQEEMNPIKHIDSNGFKYARINIQIKNVAADLNANAHKNVQIIITIQVIGFIIMI